MASLGWEGLSAFQSNRKLQSQTKGHNINGFKKAGLSGHRRTSTNTKRGNYEGHTNLQLFLP
jgi:hypothetical protein